MLKWSADIMFGYSWRRGRLDIHTEEGSETGELLHRHIDGGMRSDW